MTDQQLLLQLGMSISKIAELLAACPVIAAPGKETLDQGEDDNPCASEFLLVKAALAQFTGEPHLLRTNGKDAAQRSSIRLGRDFVKISQVPSRSVRAYSAFWKVMAASTNF